MTPYSKPGKLFIFFLTRARTIKLKIKCKSYTLSSLKNGIKNNRQKIYSELVLRLDKTGIIRI